MTKKLLAILLAVILAFTAGAVAFAEDGEGEETNVITLADEPTQEEGKIFISAKSEWVEADSTVSIPVSIISDYTSEVEDGIVFVGFTVSISDGASYAAVTGFELSNEVAAACIPELTFATDLSETFAVTIAVPSDKLDLLHQERLELGTAEVTISDAFPGEDQAIDVVVSPRCVCEDYLELEGFFEGEYAGVIDAWNDGVIVYNTSDATADMPAIDDVVILNAAHCYAEPPVQPWQDRIVEILKGWAKQILDALIAILETLEGLLEMI